MAIESICSGCGQKLSVADENAGKQARCPACGNIYTIPSPAEAAVANPNPSPSLGSGQPGTASSPAEYWMRATDGNEYGPVDQATLHRWFAEGRVGPGYQLRQGEFGSWQVADLFRPTAPLVNPNSNNPYADNPYQATAAAAASNMYRYPKSDKSGLVLAFGILGFFLCPIFAIAAWIMGHSALKDIAAGQADPSSKTLVQVGYYLGIASVVINMLCLAGYFVIIAITIVGGVR